jgi:receptor protein-tyrosine kinase
MRQDLRERSGSAVASAVTAKTARPAGANRSFKIDRNRLRAQSMITADGERTTIAESFRRVKRQILANVAGAKAGASPANLVLVTSALPGEGKTFCSINLAISIALEMDRSVLLVDTDVAKSSVPRALGLEAGHGLMEVLQDGRIDLADVLWKTDIGRLSLLPVGTAHKYSTELLTSDAMRALLRDMAERYRDRIIIFDSPPLLAASEAAALASQMGQIVLVVEAGKTSDTALKDALSRVDAGKVAGLLLNKVESASLEYGYGAYD